MKTILKKLFPKRTTYSEIQTIPLANEEEKDKSQIEFKAIQPSQLKVGCGQSVGRQREHNEDTIFSFTSILAGNQEDIPFGLFIVADGMGGHKHGEIASRVACKAVARYLIEKIYLPSMSVITVEQNESLQEVLCQAVQEAQVNVLRSVPGGGTTLTIGLLVGEQVTLAHIGDSRAYFLNGDNQLEAITRDHSLVGRLQELGQIDENEAYVHPQRNVLYRAIGQAEPIEPDINTLLFPPNGLLVFCSDGLWSVIPNHEIVKTLNSTEDPMMACQALINKANDAGGPDNISVIIVKISS